ncbi:ABC transporter substrate-binding protein [Niveibacterium sp. 24ML]|uniref:ABC transporter substrate-binding protein n=1 Tax=Niveibacterium sp. 24ML TaxID=2985512 RepID=UPI00226E21D6|nr:ABC transporter substrate-binding protein [Niveibacterium sp. 24ML]MCX9155153.1 ABC transporter substrate-binding protein [Niveibacterium sp. 24ML]
MIKKLKQSLLAAALAALCGHTHAADVEVLHWWTSGGEAKALAELTKKLEANGHRWRDFSVTGGGGDNAMLLLKTRVVSGYPPMAAQIKGPEIRDWAEDGLLADIGDIAKAGNWDATLPTVVANAMKYEGRYVAAPVNVHRVNWMWINPEVLKKAGVEPPASWDALIASAENIRKAGFIPIAHGGQPWQDFTLFESVALGVGGADFYRKAFVTLDPATLQSATMTKVLDTFKSLRKLIDAGANNREWSAATALVINGKAAVQFMGDWAKGEFARAGKQPGRDYLCLAAPGSDKAYTYNIDSFAFFRQRQDDARKAQADLANALMGAEFQENFNLAKGSIPARTNARMDRFDDCAKRSAEAFRATAQSGGLVPSIAHRMAAPEAVQSAMQAVVSSFFNDPAMNSREAQTRLVQAVSANAPQR